MGTFTVSIELGDPQGSRFEILDALVDTGASYTWVPASVLAGLGLTPTRRFPFVFADGRRVLRDMAETRIRLEVQEQTTWVVFGDEGTQVLLGAYTLEGFGLAVDPHRRLVPITVWLATGGLRSTTWRSVGSPRGTASIPTRTDFATL